jgi:hypothetical protein
VSSVNRSISEIASIISKSLCNNFIILANSRHICWLSVVSVLKCLTKSNKYSTKLGYELNATP